MSKRVTVQLRGVVMIRRRTQVDLPAASGFRTGERIYFCLVGREMRISRAPQLWSDGRYRSARVKRCSRERRLQPLQVRAPERTVRIPR